MSQSVLNDENSTDYELISSIERIDIIFDENDSLLNQVNQSIDRKEIEVIYGAPVKTIFFRCDLDVITNKIFDLIGFMFLILNIILELTIAIVIILISTISLYSVLIMYYVFFISSIISYTMAPLYTSLSHDWLNFFFSFAQVILASPLIAFYIYFILKSIIEFGNIILDIPTFIKKIALSLKKANRKKIYKFFSMLFSNNYKTFFDNFSFFDIIFRYIGNSFSLCSYVGLGYLFFFQR